jgi:hypothetical protein
MCKEIKTIIKNLPTKKILGFHGFTDKCHQMLEDLTSILLKFFQNVKDQRTLPNSFISPHYFDSKAKKG